MSSLIYPMGFPTKIFNWKGKSFFQVIASIQKNQNNAPRLSIQQLRKPLPLKLYRKEIHNISGQNLPKSCNVRTSTKISDFDIPGNNIVSEISKTYTNGLVNTLDVNPTSLSAENGSCNTQNNCFSPAYNARKRCRSAGMIPKKFNKNKNNDTYSTSTQQYLTSRNMTIKQNEFNYIRKGTSGIFPGPGLAASNVYSPSGLSHCYQPMISAENKNNVITYIWIDKVQYTATIPDGIYDINSLNAAFQAQHIINKTYLIGPNNSKVFLLAISYNTNTQSLILIANVASNTSYPSAFYTAPNGATWSTSSNYPSTDPTPTAYPPVFGATYFIISPYTKFADLVGFAPGTYFAGATMSSNKGYILPNYVPLYFKPNNVGFGVQGAVDASTLTQRVKYNEITNAASGLRSAYGNAAANALSYGVSEQAYTIKSVVGDKVIYSPIINPRTGTICKKNFIYRM
jgi:hypothetical protein